MWRGEIYKLTSIVHLLIRKPPYEFYRIPYSIKTETLMIKEEILNTQLLGIFQRLNYLLLIME